LVDFNNEVTVGTPAVDIVRVLILQRRNDVIEAIEHYSRQAELGYTAEIAPVRSRLKGLLLELGPLIARHHGEEALASYETISTAGDIKDIKEIFGKINFLLDEVKLIRIDTRKNLGGNLRDRNQAQGWKA